MIRMKMMLEVVIGVMVMEVDKMADQVTDMEVNKVTGAIGDTYRDDIRSGRQVGRHVLYQLLRL